MAISLLFKENFVVSYVLCVGIWIPILPFLLSVCGISPTSLWMTSFVMVVA